MYVRLAFAVAAHLEPEILVVDEVLAVGDAEFQKKCIGKMGEVAKGGRTVIFVSHQLPSVARLCNRTMLFETGRLKAQGTPEEMISLYRGEGTSAAIDISRPDDTKKDVQLTNIAIENDDTADGEELLTLDRPLTVTARLKAEKHTGGVTLSFALLTPDGTVVFASNSENAGIDVSFSDPGERYVSLTLGGEQLLNGVFVCRLALWSRADGIFDEYETDSIHFTPRQMQALPILPKGFVNAQVEWRVEDVRNTLSRVKSSANA
jgi:lipopolysaccharide transport system ATP-binding protein